MSAFMNEPLALTFDDGGPENPALRDKDGEVIADVFGAEKGRRIVACVNACAGIDTEALESTKTGELCELVAWKIEQVEKQRDDLLAALEKAKSKMEAATKCHPQATVYLLGEAHEVIDAAIASVKGGE